MILNLIDSLVDEKQLDSNCDENLLVTIDSLISSLKHLRERIKTINHDDTHPLNLTKPKSKPQQTRPSASMAEERQSMRPSPSTVGFPLPSPIFTSQPFFSPFSGKNLSLAIDRDRFLPRWSSGEHDTPAELYQTDLVTGSERLAGTFRTLASVRR